MKNENLNDSRNMNSSANATVSRRESEQNKSRAEFIQKYGPNLGQKAYGAIKELEEFLDPNVYNDEEFQLQQKTKKQLSTVEHISRPMEHAVAQVKNDTSRPVNPAHGKRQSTAAYNTNDQTTHHDYSQ